MHVSHARGKAKFSEFPPKTRDGRVSIDQSVPFELFPNRTNLAVFGGINQVSKPFLQYNAWQTLRWIVENVKWTSKLIFALWIDECGSKSESSTKVTFHVAFLQFGPNDSNDKSTRWDVTFTIRWFLAGTSLYRVSFLSVFATLSLARHFLVVVRQRAEPSHGDSQSRMLLVVWYPHSAYVQ
jgi:hypothetical protein